MRRCVASSMPMAAGRCWAETGAVPELGKARGVSWSGMKALALLTLVVMAGASGCEPTRATRGTPEAQSSSPRGAGPGGFLPSVCVGQDDVRTWKRADPSTINWNVPESWRGSQCAWSVTMHSGVPIVSATDEKRDALRGCPHEDSSGQPCVVQRGRAGVLIGFDGGEWGGSLSWRAAGGAFRHVLLDSNVVAILPAGDEFVALTYVGHGSEGRAVQVLDMGNGFNVGKIVDLPGAPSAGAVESAGTILVAAGKTLLRFSRGLQQEQLLDSFARHPRSLTIASPETVYVGMHGLVVELQMSVTPPTQTWLYPF